MTETPFAQINADGVNVERIMQEIRARVDEKKARGDYDQYDLTGLNLSHLPADDDLLPFVLKIMKKSWEIEIGDFEIRSAGGLLGWIEVRVKKVIWFLLKFYTYRMFTQQREFNIQVVTALNGLHARLTRLEQQAPAQPGPRR